MIATLRARQRASRDSGPSDDAVDASRRSAFRPSPRRRNRIAAGVALGAAAIGGNVLVYTSLDDREPVVQVVRDVPAGTRLTPDMVRTVDAQVDGSVNVVPGDRLDEVIGQHARVRMVSGSLVTTASLQPGPLVEPGNAVVAIRVPEGSLPVGLRERVPVRLVLPGDDADIDVAVVDGVVVALPTPAGASLGMLSLSVELADDDASVIAAADDVRVVLVAPDTAGGEGS